MELLFSPISVGLDRSTLRFAGVADCCGLGVAGASPGPAMALGMSLSLVLGV